MPVIGIRLGLYKLPASMWHGMRIIETQQPRSILVMEGEGVSDAVRHLA